MDFIRRIKKPITEQQIISLLKVHYGVDILATQPLTGSADANALVYKAETSSNAFFVKFKYGHQHEVNFSVINLLHELGIKEVIFPILSCEGKLFQQLDDFKIIVYPFIQAPNGFTQDLSKENWKQLGNALRKVHETSVPTSIQQHLKKESYSAKWRELVKSFYNRIEPEISDDKITIDFKTFFKKNINVISQVVNTAEKLSKTIQPDLDKYVLCHSDIHAGNILVSSQEFIYIIDWDEPMLAPKERDLMFIGGGVGNVWNKLQEIPYFYEGYGKVNIDITMLSYYRYERIVVDIAEFGQDLLSHDQSNESRLEMLKHFKSQFEPNGVIDIAFATNPTV